MTVSRRSMSRDRALLANPLVLIATVALILAVAAILVRRDILLTRLSVNQPNGARTVTTLASPQLGMVLAKVARSDWQYRTTSYDTYRASQALEFVRTELKITQQNASQHLKLWDLLDEGYVSGPDTLATKALLTYAASLYVAEPINQAGLCDYLDSRTVPAMNIFLARRDYAGARALSLEANAWIDALKPNPQLAGESPRLQSYINLFRKIDALLDDPGLLYANPEVASKVADHLRSGKPVPSTMSARLTSDRNIDIAAWGHYLAAATKLSTLHHGEAAQEFRDVVGATHNKKLAELAKLGYVRATFWTAMTGGLPPASAAQAIEATAFGSDRYSRDAAFYVAQLRRSAPESEKHEEGE